MQVDYKTILSPEGGMNIYRGCTHGCSYCDSRSVCYQMKHANDSDAIADGIPAYWATKAVKPPQGWAGF